MKAIVFGGSGFLGSHVADTLTERGFKVTIFDLKKSPYLQKMQEMVVGNILNEALVEKVIKGASYVYNFAGIPDIAGAQKKPLECIKYNVIGNTIILEGCRKAKIKRFIFASSLYVYSKAGTFYRSTKQACELIIENYQEVFGLPYTILRYGSLYGPRADKKNFIYNIINQALTKNMIVRNGDGEEIR
ncbi:MAG: NAD(P)-dependent oxidoreductase, partial [Candidatus Omnitrophica bacterium]|nr:NAD(P)-dependent oxidoreductase [Candidatus Omnitrophota bacterium]